MSFLGLTTLILQRARGTNVDIATRTVAAVSQASFVLLQNSQTLQQQASSQPVFARCASLANSAAEQGNDFVVHFVLCLERFKLTGAPRLNFRDEIANTSGELAGHLRTLNTIYRSADPRPALGNLVARNEEVIQRVEVMLNELTHHPDLQASLEAIVESYPTE